MPTTPRNPKEPEIVMKERLQQPLRFMVVIFQMVSLVWQAQPLICLSLVLLTILQGAFPLATAWLTKLLFDLLVLIIQGDFSPQLIRPLALILAGQALLILLGQLIVPLNRYLNAELGRCLTIVMQMEIYQKIGRFAGIAYFENPEFHNKLQLAVQGVQFRPADVLYLLTNLLQNLLSLIGFVVILLAFSPLLAMLVILAVLPQLFIQFKIGQQRFGLSLDLSADERYLFYYGHLLTSPYSAKDVRLFGLVDYFLTHVRCTYHKVHQAQQQQELRELYWSFF